MSSTFSKNTIMPGKFNNYLIAGNITNAFAIGEIGSFEDFFMIGSEPNDESMYPMITGNFLDSEKNVLFRLVRNVLVMNPGNCSKIIGNHIGYEIHDSAGQLIFKVETKFDFLPELNEEFFVTTISANCFDKNGNQVFKAISGIENEHIESSIKCLFGYSGSIGINYGYNKEEVEFIRFVFGSNGIISQRISGLIENKEINLDGMALHNVTIRNCIIHVSKGDFIFVGTENHLENCEWVFHDQALQMIDIFQKLESKEN